MAASRAGHRKLVINYDLNPFLGLHVELPEVIKFDIVFTLASENIHVFTMYCCSVACSWIWFGVLCRNALPLLGIQVESVDLIRPLSTYEATKCNDRVWGVLDGCVLIE